MKKADSATPNQLLRNQRKLHYWTQSQVAEKIGTTTVNVNRWESGLTFPSLYFRQKLCELFGKNPEELGLIPEKERQQQAAAVASSSFPALWNVPFRRNPFFTGREEVLIRLHQALKSGQVAAVAQTQAISGLGGIGKTQTVVEYAYRYYRNYSAILWVKADSHELLTADIVELAHLLNLSEKDEQEQSRAVAAVKRWLNGHSGWLLILDNVEDVELASDFLPSTGTGNILLTTRAFTTGAIAQRIELKKMEPEEGALFLLRRAKLIAPEASLQHASPAERAKAQELSLLLDGLPLALDQAGAYIEETDCGLSGYLTRYQLRRAALLSLRGASGTDHPEPVATTWSLSFEKLQQANPVAADLLRLCAFLHPDAIPEEILTAGAAELGPMLQPIAADPLALDVAIRDLRKFSLLRRDPEAHLLMVHRLVQEVLKDGMDEQTQQQWAERTVHAVNRAFPDVEFATWQRCQRCLPHAQVCATLIEQWNLAFSEAARLCNRTGRYLEDRALYAQAKPLLLRSLAIYEEVAGLEHPDTAQSLNDLAVLYRCQGEYEQAEPLLRRALAIREQELGPEHFHTISSLNYLAGLYEMQGKYTQAEPLYQRALDISERVLGPNNDEVGAILNNLAGLYERQGKYAQAEPLYQRAVHIAEQVLGPEHPDTGSVLDNLARLYRLQGKYEQAEPLIKRALKIFEQVWGEHPDTATALENLAILYRCQRKYEQAEPLIKRAWAIGEQVLGLEHPHTARILENYASLLREMRRANEAARLEAHFKAARARSLS